MGVVAERGYKGSFELPIIILFIIWIQFWKCVKLYAYNLYPFLKVYYVSIKILLYSNFISDYLHCRKECWDIVTRVSTIFFYFNSLKSLAK